MTFDSLARRAAISWARRRDLTPQRLWPLLRERGVEAPREHGGAALGDRGVEALLEAPEDELAEAARLARARTFPASLGRRRRGDAVGRGGRETRHPRDHGVRPGIPGVAPRNRGPALRAPRIRIARSAASSRGVRRRVEGGLALRPRRRAAARPGALRGRGGGRQRLRAGRGRGGPRGRPGRSRGNGRRPRLRAGRRLPPRAPAAARASSPPPAACSCRSIRRARSRGRRTSRSAIGSSPASPRASSSSRRRAAPVR